MEKNDIKFGFPPETTDWVAAFLSSVGRLLALASDFEFHCHAMAEHLGLVEKRRGRPSILYHESDEAFESFLTAVTTEKNINAIQSFHIEKITSDSQRQLVIQGLRAYQKALGDLAFGLKDTSTHQKGRAALIRDLVKTTHNLAEPDRLVSTLVVFTLRGDLPSEDEYASYIDDVEEWVLQPVQHIVGESSKET